MPTHTSNARACSLEKAAAYNSELIGGTGWYRSFFVAPGEKTCLTVWMYGDSVFSPHHKANPRTGGPFPPETQLNRSRRCRDRFRQPDIPDTQGHVQTETLPNLVIAIFSKNYSIKGCRLIKHRPCVSGNSPSLLSQCSMPC